MPQASVPYPYTVQWNFTLQHQFRGDTAVEASYVGLKGTHLQQGSFQRDQISPSLMSQGASVLQKQVPNPFYHIAGISPTSTLYTQTTVQAKQLLSPYPQYTGVSAFRIPSSCGC